MTRLPLVPLLRLDIRDHGRRLTIVGKTDDVLAELEAALRRVVDEEVAEARSNTQTPKEKR